MGQVWGDLGLWFSGGLMWVYAYACWTRNRTKRTLRHKGREIMDKAIDGIEEETYGHQRNPVNWVYEKLPKPPEGWLWEISVVPNKLKAERTYTSTNIVGAAVWMLKHYKEMVYEVDSLALEIKLIGLADNHVRDTYRRDLIWFSWEGREWMRTASNHRTWQSQYGAWPGDSSLRREEIVKLPGEVRVKA